MSNSNWRFAVVIPDTTISAWNSVKLSTDDEVPLPVQDQDDVDEYALVGGKEKTAVEHWADIEDHLKQQHSGSEDMRDVAAEHVINYSNWDWDVHPYWYLSDWHEDEHAETKGLKHAPHDFVWKGKDTPKQGSAACPQCGGPADSYGNCEDPECTYSPDDYEPWYPYDKYAKTSQDMSAFEDDVKNDPHIHDAESELKGREMGEKLWKGMGMDRYDNLEDVDHEEYDARGDLIKHYNVDHKKLLEPGEDVHDAHSETHVDAGERVELPKIRKNIPELGVTLKWYGGHGIHVFSDEGEELDLYSMGDFQNDNSSEESVKDSMNRYGQTCYECGSSEVSDEQCYDCGSKDAINGWAWWRK